MPCKLLSRAMCPARIPHARPRLVSQRAEPLQSHGDPESLKVFGLGGCGLDYLAQVAAWPNPDDKLRTESLQTQGGGNCANALTAASRLGVPVSLISKIGDDGIGEEIVNELHEDGISTDYLIRAQNAPSPFTYIIVDRKGGTRTCIHTPSEPLKPSELQPKYEDIISQASLLYFDGRLTEAALELAEEGKKAGKPILVEAERLRPNLEQLLQSANYVTTSSKFPKAWTGEEDLGDGLLEVLFRLPNASWCFTTLGASGAILVERAGGQQEQSSEDLVTKSLSEVIKELKKDLEEQSESRESQPACTANNGTEIWDGKVISSQIHKFTKSDGANSGAKERAKQAAVSEAERNAGGGDAASYSSILSESKSSDFFVGRVILASAADIPKAAITDTTGAGDATVGTFLYGLSEGLPLQDIMKLAAVVSARKCTDFGARSALPTAAQIRANLLRAKAQQ